MKMYVFSQYFYLIFLIFLFSQSTIIFKIFPIKSCTDKLVLFTFSLVQKIANSFPAFQTSLTQLNFLPGDGECQYSPMTALCPLIRLMPMLLVTRLWWRSWLRTFNSGVWHGVKLGLGLGLRLNGAGEQGSVLMSHPPLDRLQFQARRSATRLFVGAMTVQSAAEARLSIDVLRGTVNPDHVTSTGWLIWALSSTRL